MKIAIMGTGAMGSVYAALLADAGNEVWAIDTWQAHVDAIRAQGLRVEGASGDRVVRVNASTEAADAGPCDLVILATKAMHVEEAARAATPLLADDTTVLSIQNGIGGPDRVAELLGEERVAVGVVGGFGASIKGPGHAHHNGMELVRLGERGRPVGPRLRAIAKVWEHAGFRVKTYDDIDQLVWEKLICNVCFSGPCTVTGRTLEQVMADPHTWMVAVGCAREAYEVARARDIYLSFDDVEAYVHDFGTKIPKSRPSMLLDHLASRRSEIDAINGAIGPAAEALGMRAPYNEVISSLVRAREAEF